MIKTVYLVGTMDSSQDGGVGWRQKIKTDLEKFNIHVIDPSQSSYSKQNADRAKQSKDWATFVKLMDDMWEENRNSVTQCDFLIAHFTHPPEQWSGGTMREIQLAFEQKKPVYLVYDEDINRIKNHVLHMFVKYGEIFKTFNELVLFLQEGIKA